MNTKPALERFEEKYLVDTATGCWNWIGSSCVTGYGQLFFNGKLMRAHRFSYQQFVGPLLDNKYVLHKCDNPACVNPEHLFLGTQQDNMSDKCIKGRQPFGENHYAWKLDMTNKRRERREYQRQYYRNKKLKEV